MVFWLVIVGSFGLRLFLLFWSFWLDEAIQWRVSYDWKYYLSFAKHDFNPPLFYGLSYVWQGWLPDNWEYDWVLRLLPLVVSGVLMVSFYVVMRLKVNERVARAGLVLLLSSPLIMYYSVEYRAYILATLLGFWFVVLWRWWLMEANDFSWKMVGISVLIGVMLLTHYSLVFLVVAGLLVGWYYKRELRWFLVWGLGGLIAALVWGEVFYQQWLNSKVALLSWPNWRQVLGVSGDVKQWVLIWVKFVVGRISFEPKTWFYGVAVLAAVPFWWYVWQGGKRDRLVFYVVIVTLMLAGGLGWFSYGFSYFRLMYLLPVIIYLAGLGVASVAGGYRWLVYLVGLGFVSGVVLIVNPKFYKEDWRSLVGFLNAQDKKQVLILPKEVRAPLEFYRLDDRYRLYDVDLKNKLEDDGVYVVDYAKLIFNSDDRLQQNLKAAGYKLRRRFEFDGAYFYLDYYVKEKMIK